MDKEAVRSDVYFLLAGPVPELRLAASELVATLLLDAAEQHANVCRGRVFVVFHGEACPGLPGQAFAGLFLH